MKKSGQPINIKCKMCSSRIFQRGTWRPKCYHPERCRRRRSYYRNLEKNRKAMRDHHKYIKYKGDKCAMCKSEEREEMPNHIKNRITVDGKFEVVDTLIDKYGTKAIEETKGQGGINVPWYSWSCDNWVTKWNSYTCERLATNVFSFETAWSNVAEFIAKMTKNSAIEIYYKWSDEDTGCNCWYALIKKGVAKTYKHENCSKEAYELAFKLRPTYKENYKFVDGKYEYVEEDCA